MSKTRQFSKNPAEQGFLTEISDCFHRQAFLAESLASEDPAEKWGLQNSFVSMFVANEPVMMEGESLGLKGALRFASETGALAKMPQVLASGAKDGLDSKDVSVFILAFGKDSHGEHAELNGQRFLLDEGQASSPGLDQRMMESFEIARASRASILAVDGIELVDSKRQKIICAALLAGGFSQIVCQVGSDFIQAQLSTELKDLSIVWDASALLSAPEESGAARPARGMGARSRH